MDPQVLVVRPATTHAEILAVAPLAVELVFAPPRVPLVLGVESETDRDRVGTGGFHVTSTCELSDEHVSQGKGPLSSRELETRDDLSSQDMSGNSEVRTGDSRDHGSLSRER